ncbi:MAG: hypothetical protein GY858_00915 [Candidatus Omnitrophica bacterium]|nr:hypothetical protein [Candidatus Omnitrophota bacterium]
MLNALKKLVPLLKALLHWILFAALVLACAFLMLFILAIASNLSDNLSRDFYKFFLTGAALVATLAGLSLRLASLCEIKQKKEDYYQAGETLIHSVIYLAMAIVLKYSLDLALQLSFLSFPFKKFMSYALYFIYMVLIWFSLRNIVLAVNRIWGGFRGVEKELKRLNL